jgi:hypothetical protein
VGLSGRWSGWLTSRAAAVVRNRYPGADREITRDLLDVILVDHATESAAPKPPRPRETHR